MMKNVHLICNAHLDPVWLWRWEEGCTEALSTFRTAAKLIDEFPGFVFNHNESVLYKWVKEHDPVLFTEIQQKVKEGTWEIMGGWYIQPDANMPAGESFVRNILTGRKFFSEEFGKRPTTAINFDSFGHSRGLVQILTQAGYDSYLVCRPAKQGFPFAEQDFIWKGLGESEIIVHRSDENYNSVLGKIAEELKDTLPTKTNEAVTLHLWGVGDHGGGPSRKDLADLQKMIDESAKDTTISHSSAEAYFEELRDKAPKLPVISQGLNPVAPGCYTSQIRIKQKHRQLENEIYSTEKMASAAMLAGLKPYNTKPIDTAVIDLLFSEFHDALPGSGSQLVEEDTIRQLEHGLFEMSQEKLAVALALSAGQPPVIEGTSSVLVYNPHPYDISGITEIEFGMPKQNWNSDFLYPQVQIDGEDVPTQAEKETSNFAIDWRKKAAVEVTLPASSMTRMDVSFHSVPKRSEYKPLSTMEPFVFDNGKMKVVINTATGLVDEYSVNGHNYCKTGSFQLIAVPDVFNSWGILPCNLQQSNTFALLTPHEGSAFSGLFETVAPSVRMIEDGKVRTVIEAVFGYHDSYAYQRYMLPKNGENFEVETGVYWNEKDTYVKLRVDTTIENADYMGQISFGRETLKNDGSEVVAHKWVALSNQQRTLGIINNGTYGSSAKDGSIGLTLLRSAGYSAGDLVGKAMREIRYNPRMEQGERIFRFKVEAGKSAEILSHVDAKALAFNEKPYVVPFCPSGKGTKPLPTLTLDNDGIMLSSMKQAEDGSGTILRFYECQGKEQTVNICLLGGVVNKMEVFKPFEIKTFHFNAITNSLTVTTLLEGL